MSKFTAAELVEFYQQVADGECAEFMPSGREWLSAPIRRGPTLTSHTNAWRIKPKTKIIDMSHLIKSGIDCEFSRGDMWRMLSGLVEVQVNPGSSHHYITTIGQHWKQCRPRMNHKMFHDGGDCPLPEGFEVEVYFRDGSIQVCDPTVMAWGQDKHPCDIIGYKIVGLADGWAYPWEA